MQQNLAPHIKGCFTKNGDMLLKREWAEGLQLDRLVTADGQTLTVNPDGWLTRQDVLTAIAEERSSNDPRGPATNGYVEPTGRTPLEPTRNFQRPSKQRTNSQHKVTLKPKSDS